MTADEFNTKYNEYLESNHYGLDIHEPSIVKFLDEFFEEYLTKIEGFKYTQIKIKYDDARFYFRTNTDHADYATNEALCFLVENTINMLWKLSVAS